MPKGSYHVGNAISQMITDVLVAFYRMIDPHQHYLYVNHAWNVHGLPFEQLYAGTRGHPGSYYDIQMFAEQCIEVAVQEKTYFVDYSSQKDNITYIDTDPICKEFSAHCFHQLVGQDYIMEYQGECYLNLEKFFMSEGEAWLSIVQKMQVAPAHHRAGIVTNQRTL
jgi:isoleucyl-tRNA synthetase